MLSRAQSDLCKYLEDSWTSIKSESLQIHCQCGPCCGSTTMYARHASLFNKCIPVGLKKETVGKF